MKWSPLSLILPTLGSILIVLKLTGLTTASWWIVLAPFWFPAAVVISILGAVLCLVLAITMIKVIFER